MSSKLNADIDQLRAQRAQLESLMNRSEYRLTAMGQVSRGLSRASRRHRSQSVRSRGETTDGETDADASDSAGNDDDDDEDDAYTVRTKQLDDAETVANARLDEQRARVREMEETYERAKKAAEDAAAALRAERKAEREKVRERSTGPGGAPREGRSIVQMAQDALKPLPQGFTAFKNISTRFRSGDLPALAYHVAVVRLFTNANAAALNGHEAARAEWAQAQQSGRFERDDGSRVEAPQPLDPDELPLRVFRRFFPKLVAVLPDPKQRSVLVRLHAQWEEAQNAAESAAVLREQAARAMGLQLPPSASLQQLPQVIPGSAAAQGLPGGGLPVSAASAADFPSLNMDPATLARHQMLQALRHLQGARKFADAATVGQVRTDASAARRPTREELFPTLGGELFQAAVRDRSKSRSRRAVFRSLSMGRAARFKPVPFHMLTTLSLGKALDGSGKIGGGEEGAGEGGNTDGSGDPSQRGEGGTFPSLGYRPPAPSFTSQPFHRAVQRETTLDDLADDAEDRPAPSYNQSVSDGLTRVLDTAFRTSATRGAAFMIQSGGVRSSQHRSHSVSGSSHYSSGAGQLLGSSGASLARWRGVFGRQKGGGNDFLDDETKSMRVSTTLRRGPRGRAGGAEGGDYEYDTGEGGDRATIRAGGPDEDESDARTLASGRTGRQGLAVDGASRGDGASSVGPASLFSSDFLRRRDVTRLAAAGPSGGSGSSTYGSGAGDWDDTASARSSRPDGLRPKWERLVRMDPIAGVTFNYGSRDVYDSGPKREKKGGGGLGTRGSSAARKRK